MEGISDLRICGIDPQRPPRILKEPYINLYFKLLHKAPGQWCEDFNRLVARGKYPVRIDPANGLFIETWVRKPEEIENALKDLKQAVRTCNKEYIAAILAAASASANSAGELTDEGEQGRLNRIIAELDFDA
jgi:hypothetical protein